MHSLITDDIVFFFFLAAVRWARTEKFEKEFAKRFHPRVCPSGRSRKGNSGRWEREAGRRDGVVRREKAAPSKSPDENFPRRLYGTDSVQRGRKMRCEMKRRGMVVWADPGVRARQVRQEIIRGGWKRDREKERERGREESGFCWYTRQRSAHKASNVYIYTCERATKEIASSNLEITAKFFAGSMSPVISNNPKQCSAFSFLTITRTNIFSDVTVKVRNF